MVVCRKAVAGKPRITLVIRRDGFLRVFACAARRFTFPVPHESQSNGDAQER
jgi:hypothetical protein